MLLNVYSVVHTTNQLRNAAKENFSMNRSRITSVLLSLALGFPVYVLAEPAITLPGEKDYGENCPYDAEANCIGEDCLNAPAN
jgi:hypothetical protein